MLLGIKQPTAIATGSSKADEVLDSNTTVNVYTRIEVKHLY